MIANTTGQRAAPRAHDANGRLISGQRERGVTKYAWQTCTSFMACTEWLTITFHLLERCPEPFPVQFVVAYTAAGKMATTQLDEFPDLGQVTFSGCPSTQ